MPSQAMQDAIDALRGAAPLSSPGTAFTRYLTTCG
jgi:hypothetical protein